MFTTEGGFDTDQRSYQSSSVQSKQRSSAKKRPLKKRVAQPSQAEEEFKNDLDDLTNNELDFSPDQGDGDMMASRSILIPPQIPEASKCHNCRAFEKSFFESETLRMKLNMEVEHLNQRIESIQEAMRNSQNTMVNVNAANSLSASEIDNQQTMNFSNQT
jgi:hypothetical protein